MSFWKQTEQPAIRWYRNGTFDANSDLYGGGIFLLDKTQQIWAQVARDTNNITISDPMKADIAISPTVRFGFNPAMVFCKDKTVRFCSREFQVLYDLESGESNVEYQPYPLPQFVCKEQWQITDEYTRISMTELRA